VFISEVVHARSNCQDLQYHYDAVARLGEAQTLCAVGKVVNVAEQLEPRRFLSPGALWWAFDWESAQTQFKLYPAGSNQPKTPEGWKSEKGCVLLIDEIDKADIDLPNGLLETLGNGAFTIPWGVGEIGLNEHTEPPLVIITTNEERELPAAFLRRCLVLHLYLPDTDPKILEIKNKDPKTELISWLIRRGQTHFGETCSETVYARAAELLWTDRQKLREERRFPLPGQAEYLDMVRAVRKMGADDKKRLEALDIISEYALRKHSKETS
jgi:MoxR-like ATPase